jgi:hypothetical protein
MLAALAMLVPERLPWVSLYWLFTLISGVMLITLWVTRFPAVQLKADEKAGTWPAHRALLNNKIVALYFISTFAYEPARNSSTLIWSVPGREIPLRLLRRRVRYGDTANCRSSND